MIYSELFNTWWNTEKHSLTSDRSVGFCVVVNLVSCTVNNKATNWYDLIKCLFCLFIPCQDDLQCFFSHCAPPWPSQRLISDHCSESLVQNIWWNLLLWTSSGKNGAVKVLKMTFAEQVIRFGNVLPGVKSAALPGRKKKSEPSVVYLDSVLSSTVKVLFLCCCE